MRRLRLRLGVWLLKPHWVPLLEHYTRLAETAPIDTQHKVHCTYIVIGIKQAVHP